MYSLGCTLYYLLIGRPPYPDGTPIEKLFKHQLEPIPLLRELRPDVPEPLSRLAASLMAKKADDRPADAAAVAAALEPFTRYDFRPAPTPAKKREAAARTRLPAAPTAAAPNAAGHYSLADDGSATGEAGHARPPGSSVVGLPAARLEAGGAMGGHTPTDAGPLTSRSTPRVAAVAADRPPRAPGRRGPTPASGSVSGGRARAT